MGWLRHAIGMDIVSKFADHLPLYRLEQIAAANKCLYRVLPYPQGLAWRVVPEVGWLSG
ncbi:MAG: hypothetical protein IPG70_16285 [Moraxellaceae bacterium]|nr:hypothetical protein [Moraxellaceae bacterium]